MSKDNKIQPSTTLDTRHNNHKSGKGSCSIQVTSSKRKISEPDLEAEGITLNNPIWAAAEKGMVGQHIHTSKTALRLIGGLDGALSKDMARVHFTVHALRGVIKELETRKRERNGRLKLAHQKDMMSFKKRLRAAERRERRQKSREEEALETILRELQTPCITNTKRRKPLGPEFDMSKPTKPVGPSDRASNDGCEMTDGVYQSQEESDANEAHEHLKGPQQEVAGAKIAVKTKKDGPDDRTLFFVASHSRDDPAEKSNNKPTKPERPSTSLADLQAKTKSDDDLLLQKYREKPSGISLSAWCTQQGLPKQRPGGRGPFPVETHGLKRKLEATDTGAFNFKKRAVINNRKQKLGTRPTEQLPPLRREVMKPKEPCQSDFLQGLSHKNATSKHNSTLSGNSGATSSRLSGSKQETENVGAGAKENLTHREPEDTHEMMIITKEIEDPACSSSSSPSLQSEIPKLSVAEATASHRQKAFSFQRPLDNGIQAARAVLDKAEPQSQTLMQSFPSQSRSLPCPTADLKSMSPTWDSDEETLCEDIPPVGTKGYKRYVDSRLERYCAEKEVEAKQDMVVEKTPPEDPKRIVSSETLRAYTACLLAYQQDQTQTCKLHKKNIQDLTEEEFTISMGPLPVRPVLPPMIGHEITAKIHLEGLWSQAKHRFQIPAKPNGKIEPVWKSPGARPTPPNSHSSAIYKKLKGRESYKMGPKRARTSCVAPRPLPQSAGAVYQKANGSWRFKPI